VIIALLSASCSRTPQHMTISAQELNTLFARAHEQLLSDTNDMIWNERERFTNYLLKFESTPTEQSLSIILADADPHTAHGYRFHTYKYSFMTDGFTLQKGLSFTTISRMQEAPTTASNVPDSRVTPAADAPGAPRESVR
jgi:hypothetical protein